MALTRDGKVYSCVYSRLSWGVIHLEGAKCHGEIGRYKTKKQFNVPMEFDEMLLITPRVRHDRR